MHYMTSNNTQTQPLIIFVHGSPGSWEDWSQYLNGKDLQVLANMIAVDRPGFGESNPGHAEKSLQVQAALIAPLLNQTKEKQKVILVGHSFGGAVIARMAMDCPEKITNLLLLAGSIDSALEQTHWYNYSAEWRATSWMVPTELAVCNKEIMALKFQLELMKPLLIKITQPITVLQGTDDDRVPVGNADFAKKMMINASPLKIVRFPKMNHFIPWSKYEDVKKELLEIIAGLGN